MSRRPKSSCFLRNLFLLAASVSTESEQRARPRSSRSGRSDRMKIRWPSKSNRKMWPLARPDVVPRGVARAIHPGQTPRLILIARASVDIAEALADDLKIRPPTELAGSRGCFLPSALQELFRRQRERLLFLRGNQQSPIDLPPRDMR
jgi:hypothetical protein